MMKNAPELRAGGREDGTDQTKPSGHLITTLPESTNPGKNCICFASAKLTMRCTSCGATIPGTGDQQRAICADCRDWAQHQLHIRLAAEAIERLRRRGAL